MPFDLTPAAAVFMAAAILLAAFVRGYSGFGFSALVVSSASLVTHPLHFVGVVMICEFAMTFQQWRSVAGAVLWRRVGALMAGAALGFPLGLWVITSVGEDLARAIMALYVLAMCGLMSAGWRLKRAPGPAADAAVGVASGLATAPGMGGLPVASWFAAEGMAAPAFRGTLVAYFTLLDIYTAPLFWWSGLLSRDTVVASLMAAPLMIAGIWAGSRHFLHANPREFRRFATLLLAVLASLGLFKSLI